MADMTTIMTAEGTFEVDFGYWGCMTVPYEVEYVVDNSGIMGDHLNLDFYPNRGGMNDDFVGVREVRIQPYYRGRSSDGGYSNKPFVIPTSRTYDSYGYRLWGNTGWWWKCDYDRTANRIDFEVEIVDNDLDISVPYSISWTPPNSSPKCESISASNVRAGATATVRWSISDPDKDTTYTTSLKRYIKAKGSSTWVSSNLSVSSSATSFSDAIPAEYRGGEVYWEVGFRDSYGATGTAKSPTYSLNTAPTGTINVSGEIKAGESVDITWTASDADGDTVSTSQLIRYLKKKGESSYVATTLISNGGTVRSYRDVIPEDAGEGSIYYAVVLSDGSLSTTINSSAQAVERSCSLIGSVNIGGVNREITEAYVFVGGVAREVVGAYVCVNGVWRSCSGG